jgi:hypothetical protein
MPISSITLTHDVLFIPFFLKVKNLKPALKPAVPYLPEMKLLSYKNSVPGMIRTNGKDFSSPTACFSLADYTISMTGSAPW